MSKTLTFTVKTEKRQYPNGTIDTPYYRYMLLDRTAKILAQGETFSSTFIINNVPEGLGHIIRIERNGVIFDSHLDVTPESKTLILLD